MIRGLSPYVDTNAPVVNSKSTPEIFAQEARNGGTAQFWNGTIDEVRISSSARSADWIAAEYNNQSSPSTFYNFGAENP